MKILQQNLNRSTFVVWEMKRNEEPVHSEKTGVWCGMSRRRIIGPIFDATFKTAAHMEIFQHFCKSIGCWEILNWIFPAGWSDIPHFTRQHGWNSVLFRRPRHFEGTLATVLMGSDATLLFLMGLSERESLPKQTTNHIHTLKANITEEIQAVTAGVLARTFQNMAHWVQSCLDANGGHFQHMLWCLHISYTMR